MKIYQYDIRSAWKKTLEKIEEHDLANLINDTPKKYRKSFLDKVDSNLFKKINDIWYEKCLDFLKVNCVESWGVLGIEYDSVWLVQEASVQIKITDIDGFEFVETEFEIGSQITELVSTKKNFLINKNQIKEDPFMYYINKIIDNTFYHIIHKTGGLVLDKNNGYQIFKQLLEECFPYSYDKWMLRFGIVSDSSLHLMEMRLKDFSYDSNIHIKLVKGYLVYYSDSNALHEFIIKYL